MKLKKFASLLLLLALTSSLCACGGGETKVKWTLPEPNLSVSVHTKLQADYLAGNYEDVGQYANGTEELSRPAPFRLEWTATASGATVEGYTLELSTDENFSAYRSYSTTEDFVDVANLLLGTTYFWRVTASLSDGGQSVSPVSLFMTDGTGPRNLDVGGVANVRDLGGWMTADGPVRQGMIYRCGRLNKSETSTPEIEITQEGINTMLYDLGVRTEIDLRMKEAHGHESGGISSSPLGSSVQYFNVELEWGTGNYLLDNLPSVREFFRLAADEENYPFIFHCNIGTDRTGMFAFLINGLLGVAEEDLYRDYLFSNFASIGGKRTLSNIRGDYLKTIWDSEGSTLSEKIRNCLVQNGVAEEDLDSIVAIMK